MLPGVMLRGTSADNHPRTHMFLCVPQHPHLHAHAADHFSHCIDLCRAGTCAGLMSSEQGSCCVLSHVKRLPKLADTIRSTLTFFCACSDTRTCILMRLITSPMALICGALAGLAGSGFLPSAPAPTDPLLDARMPPVSLPFWRVGLLSRMLLLLLLPYSCRSPSAGRSRVVLRIAAVLGAGEVRSNDPPACTSKCMPCLQRISQRKVSSMDCSVRAGHVYMQRVGMPVVAVLSCAPECAQRYCLHVGAMHEAHMSAQMSAISVE